MISFLPELEDRLLVTPKEKGDNFISYMPVYHFNFVTFWVLLQLSVTPYNFAKIAIQSQKFLF